MFNKSIEEWKELDGLYTATEISQQPRLWEETLSIVENNLDNINSFLNKYFSNQDVDVIFTGAGTSDYIGQFVQPYLSKKCEGNFYAIPTTHIVASPEMYLKKDRKTILVNFARSGNSPESVQSVNIANKYVENIAHIFITCNSDGKLAHIAKESDNILLLLMPKESNDKSFAMTSSFSCMSLTASLIFDLDNFENNKEELNITVERAKSIIDSEYENLNLVINSDFNRVVYLGSGNNFGLAKESALKLLELTRGKVVGYSETSMGFRHGPKSIIDDNTLNFVLLSNNEYTKKYDFDIAKEIYHDQGNHKLILLGNEDNEQYKLNSDLYINIKADIQNETFIGLLYIIYAQIFSLLVSIKTGINPDNPNPSGAVNRVVQGVIIHDYE